MTRVAASPSADWIIVGGGIVGLATAWAALRRQPGCRLVVCEAEDGVAKHQSGRNSGVIHSGIYYQPGSLKATLCRRGKSLLESFCDEHDVPWERCGKVIVATTAEEIPRLESIAERGRDNAVEFGWIDTDALREIEPAVAGLAALHVRETGIVDYRMVCEVLVKAIERLGGRVRNRFDVRKIDSRGGGVRVTSSRGESIVAARLINCGGLSSDRVFRLAGGEVDIKIVPFRGEYYQLLGSAASLCRNLIYPVPDPAFPFLGVHFTRMIGGGVECGPNAVLALSRTGYRWRDVDLSDLIETTGFKGFRRLAAKHWRMGCGEIKRSLSKRAFAAALRRLVPSIRTEHLVRGRAGVRAQAVTPAGDLVDDFEIRHARHGVHVLNAPSPAATASLAIGERILEEAIAAG